MPKVTVGMPTYNRAKFLAKAIQQVLAQTFKDFEFIIYNDGSTDETISVIQSFNDDRIIKINEINRGMPRPLNEILRLAKGEYIIILHDHDFFDQFLLEKSYNALRKYPDAGFVLQGSAWIDEDGISNYRSNLLDLPEYNNGKKFLESYFLNEKDLSSPIHACCMVRKLAYDQVGKYYDEKYGWYTDNDLWFRLMQNYNFIYLNEVLFKFRGRELNHILHQKAWQIIKWTFEIHKINIQRSFIGNDVLYEKAMKILEYKIAKASKKIFYQSMIKGNKIFLDESIEEIEKYNNDLKLLFLKLLLNRNDFLKNAVLKIGPKLNRIRKLFF